MADITISNGTTNNADSYTTRAFVDRFIIESASSNPFNGSTLNVDSDPQWGKRGIPFGGNFVLNKGTLNIDARYTRWLKFDGGSGTYPRISVGASVKRSGVNLGECIGIWTTFPGNPVVYASTGYGGAAAATGWIKIRTLSSSIADNDVLTIEDGTYTMNLTADGADQIGWLTIVGGAGNSTGIMWKPNTTVNILGEWWPLGTSNGAASQTMSFYSTDYCAAVWVETGSGTGVYEAWPNIGDMAWTDIKNGEAGKVFKMVPSTGVITFGNGTNGTIPPTSAKIRVPNLTIAGTYDATAWASGVRYYSSTWYSNFYIQAQYTAGVNGPITMNKVNGSFAIDVARGSFALDYIGCGSRIGLLNISSNQSVSELCFGQTQNLMPTYQFLVDRFGGTLTASKITAAYPYSQGYACAYFSYNPGTINITNLKVIGPRGSAISSYSHPLVGLAYNTKITIDGIKCYGAYIRATGNADATLKNITFSDSITTSSPTGASNLYYGVSNTKVVVDGVTLDGVAPNGGGIFMLATGDRIDLRNVGTWATPFNCQSRAWGLLQSADVSTGKTSRCYTQNLYYYSGYGLLMPVQGDSGWVFQNTADFSGNSFFGAAGQNTKLRGMRVGTEYGTPPSIVSNGGYNNRVQTHIGSASGIEPFDVFVSDTKGAIIFTGHPPTATSPVYLWASAGTPTIVGDGTVYLEKNGDAVTWEMQYFVLGHSGFFVTGGDAYVLEKEGGSMTNLVFEYQIDKGSGYNGTWLTCNATNFTAENSSGLISPTVGFKLKVRVRATTDNVWYRGVTGFAIKTTTSAALQQAALYPIGATTVVLNGVNANSEVRIYSESGTELAGVEDCGANPTLSWATDASVAYNVRIVIVHPNYNIKEFITAVLPTTQSIPIQQEPDKWFSNP